MSNSGLITKHETVEKGHFSLIYRKIPKITPSMYNPSKYKPPKPVTQKTLR